MRHKLTINQEKLFRHFEFYPNDPSYNLGFLYKITGDVDLARLKKAIEVVYDSIDLFKVHFEKEGNELYQSHLGDRRYEVEVITRQSHESEKLFFDRAVARSTLRINTSIDLAKWPLLQFTLFASSENVVYLSISIPHLISDAFSYVLLIERVNYLYNCGYELSVDDFFKSSFLERESTSVAYRDLKFFTSELHSLDSFEIPSIKQERNQLGVLSGAFHRFTLPKEAIKTFTEEYACSENSFFLAIHALFLKKITGENKIIIGFPVQNRRKSERNIFGYFVNTLPLVIDFSEVSSFKSLIEYVSRGVSRLFRHQAFDLNNLKNVTPVFNSYFTYYDRELNFSLDRCLFERVHLKRNAITSECTFTVENRGDCYVFSAEMGEYFSMMNVEEVLSTLIEGVMHSSIESIPLVKGGVTSFLPQSERPSIAEAFTQIAGSYPDRIALSDCGLEMTYEALDKKTNQIARYLQANAAHAKHIIISLPRSNDLVAVILGVIKAGKCYVPIDTFCPPERFQYIAGQLESPVTVGSSEVQAVVPERFFEISALLSASTFLSEEPLETVISSDDLAYIIYTSGTTGKPKGVQISHGNLMSLIHACYDKFSFTPDDVWTLFHSYSFDFSVWEIFGALLSGGKLLVIDAQVAKAPEQFYELLADSGVTVLNQTPTAFRELIRVDSREQKKLQLRYVIFGGETLCFSNLKEWVDAHPLHVTKLVNMYGITETTIHVTYYEVKQEDIGNGHSIIGKPLGNSKVVILNAEGQLLPHGVKGEIAIYGDGLSCGYYNAPELTEKKFVLKDGRRLYLSGDLALMNADGDLLFLGRKDRQVQVRGYRVELDEIEFHLLKTNLVQQCAIEAILSDTGMRIVTYVVPKVGLYSEFAAREKLRESLPFYMIPSLFCCVEKIATTINGKVDFASLRMQISSVARKEGGETPTERILYTIVSGLLKTEDFSLEENFWDIGLNSIDLAAIFFHVKTQFSLEQLSMAHLFQYTTLKKLAEYIDASCVRRKQISA